MGRLVQIIFLVFISMFYYGLSACSLLDHQPSSVLEPVALTDLKTATGTWEGVMVRSPATRSNDWVTLRIEEDGMYRFESFRTIGVFSGDGRFVLEDGKLISRIPNGTITAQLHRQTGGSGYVLVTEGITSDGLIYRAQLTPKLP